MDVDQKENGLKEVQKGKEEERELIRFPSLKYDFLDAIMKRHGERNALLSFRAKQKKIGLEAKSYRAK